MYLCATQTSKGIDLFNGTFFFLMLSGIVVFFLTDQFGGICLVIFICTNIVYNDRDIILAQ